MSSWLGVIILLVCNFASAKASTYYILAGTTSWETSYPDSHQLARESIDRDYQWALQEADRQLQEDQLTDPEHAWIKYQTAQDQAAELRTERLTELYGRPCSVEIYRRCRPLLSQYTDRQSWFISLVITSSEPRVKCYDQERIYFRVPERHRDDYYHYPLERHRRIEPIWPSYRQPETHYRPAEAPHHYREIPPLEPHHFDHSFPFEDRHRSIDRTERHDYSSSHHFSDRDFHHRSRR